MQITVIGKQLDVGDALREHVVETLDPAVEKYFDHAIEATVTLTKQAHLYHTQISVHVGKGMLVQAKASADEIYPAFDSACDKVAKQLRRYKRRLRDHHANRDQHEQARLDAVHYVIAQEDDDHSDDNHVNGYEPVIVAETPDRIDTLSVGEAVMRLDLGDIPALMFRNGKHGGLNVVYRRTDGNIGWLDPSDKDAGAA
ncbi:ribosome hibernation-promoting factor, HPF/YfiA family [Thalassospira lucentensis]|uniref:ribosome hibernation-promoting factor, HPF/YfiA family n=1 Tax=Thalassospira lucentensis TaxID=168935 RepID=UPI00142E04D0|nr:ribosome-associated translation inhibitor RaiA [Thalassospira lucentensis]NIZ00690.1 ribosome-associated translation inhibitor RaiA [Thalassospira lucentensis]